MAVIDIGAAAINRATYWAGPYTVVEGSNPANDNGIINTLEIWAVTNLSNCEVATFYVVSGNNLSTRDSQTIGSVTAGSTQTFSGLSVDVLTGDYWGTYYSSGQIETDSSGGTGIWYNAADEIPCTNFTFGFLASYIISLYGTGETTVTAGKKVLLRKNKYLRRTRFFSKLKLGS